jgi:hypothetical protein
MDFAKLRKRCEDAVIALVNRDQMHKTGPVWKRFFEWCRRNRILPWQRGEWTPWGFIPREDIYAGG